MSAVFKHFTWYRSQKSAPRKMKTQENDDQFYKFFSILAPSAYSSVTVVKWPPLSVEVT